MKKWFGQVVETFKDCASLPDKGWSLKWPEHPKALQVLDTYVAVEMLTCNKR